MHRLLAGSRARVLLVSLLSVAVTLLGLGSVPSASAAPLGQISGTVTNADGDPLGGITVTAYPADGSDGVQTTTKKNGTYSLKKLAASDYTVEFMDNTDTPLYTTEYYDDHTDFQDADLVTVASGQSVSGIDAELARLGTISGTVTDERGQPIDGAFYDILAYNPDGPPFTDIGGGEVPASGHYSFPFVDAGTYIVFFYDQSGNHVPEYWDDQLSFFDADQVTVTAGGTVTGIDAQLADAGHLAGTVTDAQGDGIGDVEIQLAREVAPDEWFGFGEEYGYHTDVDGTYSIDGLPPGHYRVGFVDPSGSYLSEFYDNVTDFGAATTVDVAAHAHVTGIDAELAEAAHVTGTVTDDQGHPIEGIFVALRALEDGHWSYFGEAETAADGTYEMDGLRPGTNYRVSFESQGDWAPEYWDDSPTIDAGTPVTLTNGQTLSGVDAELAAAAHITGTAADPAGHAYDLTAVVAWRWTGTTWEDYQLSFAGDDENRPDDETAYDIGGLIPGTYRLEFDAYDSFSTPTGGGITEASHEFYDDQPSLELAQDIVVTTAGQVISGKDAVLVRGDYSDEVHNVTPPTIAGTPAVGSTLTATPGTWNLKGTTYHYQWKAGTTPVGADAPTYTPVAGDAGKAISVVVTASVAGVGSAVATSAPTAPVAGTVVVTPPPPPPPAAKKVLLVKRPAIKGSLEVGTKARVTHGQWNPATVALQFRWYVGGHLVAKARGAKLLLKEKWAGKRLRVKVVATAAGYEQAVLFTQRSARITG